MPRIFISYRRDDSAAHTGRIYDRLEGHFGPGQVFMDVDTIKPGVNFVEVVEQAVGVCDGLLAVIGRDWLEAYDSTGGRRLEDPADLVRLEIAAALERNIRVIPVLVQGTQMPRAVDLPENLRELAHRNALEVSDNRFRTDVEQLIEALEAPAKQLSDSVFMEPTQPPDSGFVGREREMGDLKAALDDALAGRGRMVMLVGEPGIGKTRMAQELALLAEQSGAQVLWGRSYEEEGAPPYWPWAQTLRTYIQEKDSEQLASEMGPGAADIAGLVSEVRAKLPDLEPTPALEPEQARFRLFDSITTFLKSAARSQPLMLVLDDLHWADRSSLLLLEFLVGEIQSSPLLVLGTYRDVEVSRRHPLSQTLGNLIRDERFLRVQLPGLAEREVDQLIQRAVAVIPPSGLSATIHQRTQGNPLFVTEIIRSLPGEGLEVGQDYLTNIPEGVRDAIGRRLNRLSEGCNQVLTTASVVGREFDFKLLINLNGEDTEDHVLEAFEEALAARVIEEPPGTMGRYQFTHALIQETLVQELSTQRRARLHGRIGQALEELYGAGAEAHAAELAHHFAEAQTTTSPGKLVRYSLIAGQRALAAYAYEDAITHFEMGLVARDMALSGTEAATDEEAADLLFGLARAQSAMLETGQLGAAFAALSRAFECYAEAGNVAQAVAAAEFQLGIPTRRIPGGDQLIARALTLVPDDSHEAGRLLSRYGGFPDQAHRLEEPLQVDFSLGGLPGLVLQ